MLVGSKDPVLSHPGAGRLRQLQAPPGRPHLDALDPKPESGCGADGFPPLHVPRLGHGPLGFLLLGWGLWVHLNHLLVHVLPEAGLLPGLGELFLQVGPVREGRPHEGRWLNPGPLAPCPRAAVSLAKPGSPRAGTRWVGLGLALYRDRGSLA